MRPDVDRAEQRARQYWYDDGVVEIAVGGVLVAVGLLFLVQYLGIIAPGASSLGLIAVVFAGWWLAGVAVRAVKTRLTYPRTGYVRYTRERGRRRSRWAVGIIGAVVGALMALLFTTTPASLNWIPALDGLLGAIFFLYMGYTVGLLRFYLLGILSVLVGAAASLAGLGDLLGSATYFGCTGVAMLVSGVLTLLNYLRHTRPSEGE